jgi:hypothetical protein
MTSIDEKKEDDLFADYEDVHVVDENDEQYFEEEQPVLEEDEKNENKNENKYLGLEEDEDQKDSYISQAPEWRTFANTPGSFDAIRTGRALRGHQSLTTIIGDGGKDKRLQRLQELINKTSRTDEEIFNDMITQYSYLLNINSNTRDDLIENISPYIKKIKYKNALVTLMAYSCIVDGKIKKDKVESILKLVTDGTSVKIRIPDIYRYAFMIFNILKKKE